MSLAHPRINPRDHGARLILAAALMLVYTLLFLGIRLYTRWPKDWRSIRAEDIVLVAAVVCDPRSSTLLPSDANE